MASYSSADLAKLFAGNDDSFRKDVLSEVTSEKLLDQLYDSNSDTDRQELLGRIIEPTKDELLELARIAQGTVTPTSDLIKWQI